MRIGQMIKSHGLITTKTSQNLNKNKTQSNPIATKQKSTPHKGKPHHTARERDQKMNNE